MTTCFLAPDPIQSTQFIPGGNVPCNGGQLFFYQNNTTTKQTVYKDSLGSVAWSNPIVLDAGGNLPSGGEVWFLMDRTYTVVYAPANDTDPPTSPYWTKDDLNGINDVPTPLQVLITSFSFNVPTTTVVFNSGISWGLYSEVEFRVSDLKTINTSTEPLAIYLSSDGGVTYATTNRYAIGGVKAQPGGAVTLVSSAANPIKQILISDPFGVISSGAYNASIRIPYPSSSMAQHAVILDWAAYFDCSTTAFTRIYGAGICAQVSSGINGVAFGLASSNAMSSGAFTVYGTLR